MSGFRLARLLRLRAEGSKLHKQNWALAQGEVLRAQDRVQDAAEAVRDARRELAAGQESGGSMAGAGVRTILKSHVALDSLARRLQADEAQLGELQRRAQELQTVYEASRREVEALEKLEQKWHREQRALRRRRDDRQRDQIIAAKVVAQSRADR